MNPRVYEQWRTIIIRSLRVTLFVYLALGLCIYIFQRNLLYFPDGKAFDVNSFGVAKPFEVIGVPVNEIESPVKSWYQPPRDKNKPVVVFMHGNASNFSLRAFRAVPLLAAGYGLLLVGYPGFDGNPGSPTEAGIYQSARGAISAVIQKGITPDHIILHGESLGTTVAVQMATEFPVAAISLEAPPTSMLEVGAYHYPIFPVRILLWDRFDSIRKIARVKAPLLLIHGLADNIVPVSQGMVLFAYANEPKKAYFLPGLGHGTALYTKPVQEKLMEFYARFSLAAPQAAPP